MTVVSIVSDFLTLLWKCSVPIQVDLLEPVSHFLDTARKNLAPEELMVTEDHKAVNFFCVPLQARCIAYHCSIYLCMLILFSQSSF